MKVDVLRVFAGITAVVCTVGATGSAFALNDAADTFYWTGAQDAFWTNANNWVCSDGTTVASTAPGVAGALSETDAWIGHRGDTAVFDGTRFAAGAANVLDLDGLLCVGNVTVQGAETPVIQFGTEAVDSQALRLYATSRSDTGGVFTVASDVVNMPVIARPAAGGLIDGEHGKNVSMYWKNEVAGKTLRFPGMAAETKNDTNIHYLHHYFTGAGSFIFDGNINRISQYNFHYEPSGPGSITFTNFTKTVTRFFAKTSDDATNTVYIAAGSHLGTDNRGYNQVSLGGQLIFEGGGTFSFLDDRDAANTYPFSLSKKSYIRFDVKVIHGEASASAPSSRKLVLGDVKVSTIVLNNPENVFDGGIRLERCNLTFGHVGALGTGDIEFGGKYALRYTGDGGVLKGTVNHFASGDMGIRLEHAGTGRLVLEGGLKIPERNDVYSPAHISVLDPDAELEIFGGLEDRRPEGATNGLGLEFFGLGRTILHGRLAPYHWLAFGKSDQVEMVKVTLASDVVIDMPEGRAASLRGADITFEGAETGPASVFDFGNTGTYGKEHVFRFTGRSAARVVFNNRDSRFRLNVFRENPDQQLFISHTNNTSLIPGSGDEIEWLKLGEAKKTSESLLDCSVRPYTGGNFVTDRGVAVNGGVIAADDPEARISLSPDGTDATGTVTLEAEGTTTVTNIIQKGRTAAVLSMAEGQSLYTGGIIGIDDEAADLTIGDKVGVGTLLLHPGSITHLHNRNTNSILTVNTAVNTDVKSVNVTGPGRIVFNGPLTGTHGITLNGPVESLTVELNGENTHSGSVFAYRGRVIVGSEKAFPPGSSVNISKGSVVDLNGIIPDMTGVTVKCEGLFVIGEAGWVFTAGTMRDFSAVPVNILEGETVTIVNAAEVAAGKRHVYTLARFMDPQTVDPEMDQATQAALGPKWNLEWNSSRTTLRLRRPCGFSIVIR